DFVYFWLIPFFVLFGLLALVSARNNVTRTITVAACVVLVLGFLFVDAKFWGVVAMGASVLILFALPWIDNSPARSMRYRPGFHWFLLGFFIVVFLVLGFLGTRPVSPSNALFSKIGTLIYFAFFLLMPWWSMMGRFKPVPDRVRFRPH
ncbi:MAG: cytochrome bc complex cytochrome b subunit, partial [Gammaproteobacteria bacterium]